MMNHTAYIKKKKGLVFPTYKKATLQICSFSGTHGVNNNNFILNNSYYKRNGFLIAKTTSLIAYGSTIHDIFLMKDFCVLIIIDFVKQIKSLKAVALIGYVAKCATIRLTTANLDSCITI